MSLQPNLDERLSPPTRDDARHRLMSRLRKAAVLIVPAATLAVTVSACGAPSHTATSEDTPSLVGIWKSSDGTGNKVVRQNGSCTGFIYSGSEVMDIGGPMMCQLSTKVDTSGRYALDVTQSPNEATYLVKFDGDDVAIFCDQDGKELYRLTRS